MEDFKPLDYTSIPPEYFKVGFVITEYNCVVEKVIGEMGDYLKQNGVMPILVQETDPKAVIEYLPECVVYFRCGTKQGTPPQILASIDGFIGYFRSLEIPVFYYLDDAYFQANDYAPLKILMNCDQLVLATEELVTQVQKAGYTRPIHLLKTHMDITAFDLLPPATNVMDRDKFNILYTSEGRIGTLMIDRICERMSQNPEKYKNVRILCITQIVAQLRAVINKWRGIEKIYYERVPLAEYYGIFKMMDLVLAPGEPGDLNYFLSDEVQPIWLASKSCVKYTIAGAAGIPCIASPWLKEYTMAIRQGENGYIANDIDEWMHYIDLMIEDKEKRKEVGLNARKDVLEKWSLIDRAKQFSDILKGNSECLVKETPKEIIEVPTI